MGSLMPGWGKTAPGVPPKGFEEAEDYTGQRSRLKLERSLSRHSADSRSSLSPRTPESAKSARQFVSAGSRSERQGRDRDALSRQSVGAILESTETDTQEDQEGKSAHGHERWWNKFDSSFLNRAIDEDPDGYRKGSYVPQNDVARAAASAVAAVDKANQ